MEVTPVDRELVAELVSAAVDSVPHPLVITDYATILFANAPACRLNGLTRPDELVGQPLSRFLHPDTREAVEQRRPVVVERRHTLRNVPTKFLTMDGTELSGSSHLVPIQFDGRPCVLWLYRSVFSAETQEPDSQAPADDALKASVFEVLPECMLIHDDRHILAANAAARHMLGAVLESDIVGQPIERIVHPDGREAGTARRRIIARSGVGRLTGISVKLVGIDGVPLRMNVDGCALHAGGCVAFLVTSTTA